MKALSTTGKVYNLEKSSPICELNSIYRVTFEQPNKKITLFSDREYAGNMVILYSSQQLMQPFDVSSFCISTVCSNEHITIKEDVDNVQKTEEFPPGIYFDLETYNIHRNIPVEVQSTTNMLFQPFENGFRVESTIVDNNKMDEVATITLTYEQNDPENKSSESEKLIYKLSSSDKIDVLPHGTNITINSLKPDKKLTLFSKPMQMGNELFVMNSQAICNTLQFESIEVDNMTPMDHIVNKFGLSVYNDMDVSVLKTQFLLFILLICILVTLIHIKSKYSEKDDLNSMLKTLFKER